MAFVVECPFCKLRAKAPDRAIGGMGKCPKCASSFTFAPADDQRLPESAAPPEAEDANVRPVQASELGAAIAAADAAVQDSVADGAARCGTPPPSQPARVAGAAALLLAGLSLLASAPLRLHGLVLPLGGVGLVTGLVGVAFFFQGRRAGLGLPLLGSAAGAGVLTIAFFFPAVLGPAYEFSRRPPDPVPAGLRAIPLDGAPELAAVPEWTDAGRYALERDGLRVRVIYVGLLPPEKAAGKARFAIGIRVSLYRQEASSLEPDARDAPALSDEASKAYALQLTEFSDLGGGANKTGIHPVPTIEETFVFDAPSKGLKQMRLKLPGSRWQSTGVFQFAIEAPPRLAGN